MACYMRIRNDWNDLCSLITKKKSKLITITIAECVLFHFQFQLNSGEFAFYCQSQFFIPLFCFILFNQPFFALQTANNRNAN